MKIPTLFLLLTFLFYTTAAQQIENFTELIPDASAITIYKENIYISRFEAGLIVKRGINETDDIFFESLVTGLGAAYGHALLGDVLYFADSSGKAIFKIDLSQPIPFVEDVIRFNGIRPIGLAIRKDPDSGDNHLYFSSYNDNLYKLNISDSPLSFAEIVLEDLGDPTGIAFYGDALYIAEGSKNEISKIDFSVMPLQAQTAYSSLSEPADLLFYGADLYITEFSGGVISKVDVTDSDATPVPVIPGLQGPSGLAIHDGYLYFGQFQADKMSKFLIDASVATNELKESETYSVYPNPTSDFLYLKDWEWKDQVEVAEIVTINGQVVKKVSLEESGSIEVADLSPGFYLIYFQDGRALKFLKE